MEVKGSVKMEIRPLHCPLQNITCAYCKYHEETYIEKENGQIDRNNNV